jgi:hypothetical protein
MSTTDAERIVIEIKRVDGTRFEVVVRDTDKATAFATARRIRYALDDKSGLLTNPDYSVSSPDGSTSTTRYHCILALGEPFEREADKPAASAKHYPQKVYVAKIRAPKPDDGDLIARCEKAARELAASKALDAPVVAARAVGGDEEPFVSLYKGHQSYRNMHLEPGF